MRCESEAGSSVLHKTSKVRDLTSLNNASSPVRICPFSSCYQDHRSAADERKRPKSTFYHRIRLVLREGNLDIDTGLDGHGGLRRAKSRSA